MVARLYPADSVGGAPAYSGRALRQTQAPFLAGATAARPLGAMSGVRPGTPSSTVTATSTTWTVTPFAGIIDAEAAAIAGPYAFAFDANVTGAVTAAGGSARVDSLSVRVNDGAEGDGTVIAPFADIVYTLSGSALPARSFVLANINVPATGGGAPSVTWVAPYAVAAGGVLPAMTKARLDTVTTATDGSLAMVSDATYYGVYTSFSGVWQRLGGKPEGTAFAMAGGSVAGGGAGGGSAPIYWGTPLTATFPVGRFSIAPVVQVTMLSASTCFATVVSTTASGCTIVISRIGSYPTTSDVAVWSATQQTPTSAVG